MQLCFKVEGEWFTNHIRDLYYLDGLSYLDCKDRLIKSLCLNELSEEEKDDLTKKIIFGEYKFVGTNSFDMVEDTDFDIYSYATMNKPKNFKEGKGIIGILTQDGVFYECSYGGHANLIDKIQNINEDRTEGALIFHSASSSYHDYADYVHKDNPDIDISYYQKRWYEKNKKYLSESQIVYLDVLVKKEV